jgi:hypothetical protein
MLLLAWRYPLGRQAHATLARRIGARLARETVKAA